MVRTVPKVRPAMMVTDIATLKMSCSSGATPSTVVAGDTTFASLEMTTASGFL